MKSIPGSRSLACLLWLLACSLSFADVAIAQAPAVPLDVTALAERQIRCREWTTLEITDEVTDRAAEVALTDLRCDRLAIDVGSLRERYSQSPATLHALDVISTAGP